MSVRHPIFTLFPYTTLFRSAIGIEQQTVPLLKMVPFLCQGLSEICSSRHPEGEAVTVDLVGGIAFPIINQRNVVTCPGQGEIVLIMRKIGSTGGDESLIFFIRFDIVVPFTNQLLRRKSARLNSSHVAISYAVFCLKK